MPRVNFAYTGFRIPRINFAGPDLYILYARFTVMESVLPKRNCFIHALTIKTFLSVRSGHCAFGVSNSSFTFVPERWDPESLNCQSSGTNGHSCCLAPVRSESSLGANIRRQSAYVRLCSSGKLAAILYAVVRCQPSKRGGTVYIGTELVRAWGIPTITYHNQSRPIMKT